MPPPHGQAGSDAAISIDHISMSFSAPMARLREFLRRPFKPPVRALTDVSFEVRPGEVFGLIGRNGAGKTTLTKIIATLVQPTDGSVRVYGFDSVRDDEKVRAQVGLATAEERSFYWRLTVEQNLMFFARLHGLDDALARRRIIELVRQFELKELVTRRFGELSTGNKQRMAFARALLSHPPVLLLDEPTRSLDPLAAARMRSLISSLAGGDPPVTVLLTSHNLAEVEELCERIAVISRGRIRAVGTPEAVRAEHGRSERQRLLVTNVSHGQALEALGGDFSELEVREQDHLIAVSFTCEAGDGALDRALLALHGGGASVISAETERATLLEVLESYEQEPEGEE